MNNNIVISGTSFLLPKNEMWNVLGSIKKLIFSEYGDWRNSIVNRKKNDYLILVIFISDLYELTSSNKRKDKEIYELTKIFLNTIKQHLKKNKSPTIIAISSWKPESIIRLTGSKSYSEKIFNIFMKGLNELKNSYPNLYIFDLDIQLGNLGFHEAFDDRNWYLARCRLSVKGLNILVQSLAKILDRIKKPSKKVLVLDCDNTLWGGIVGEDGIEGINLGQDGEGAAFVDFQKVAKKLNEEGILLAICSKNNEKEVLNIFENHQSMAIKKNNISSYRINWKEKTENLIEIASELNLDLNSFVFWDDNPIERDKIRKILPQVLTVEPPANIVEWPKLLAKIDCFAKFSVTDADKKKTEQYFMHAKFSKDKSYKLDETVFLKSIKLKAKSIPIDQDTIKRAAQLCQKTNQFNLRTIRYTESEIKELKKNNDINFLVNLNDLYGDHGLVGLVCTKKLNKKFIFLEVFLMSCRVFGRRLESWMISQILTKAKKKGYKYVVAEYIQNKKNSVTKNFLPSNCFVKLDKKKYRNLKVRNFSKGGNLYICSVNEKKIPYFKIYE